MARKARKYTAAKDYGTRGSEVGKFKVPFGGQRATIYRRKDSGASTWHFRLYVRDEGVHYRRSLKTSDRREAVQFAEKEIISILAKQQNGLKVISPTFAEAVRAFQLSDEAELNAGVVSARTVKVHNHYIKIGTDFIKHKFKTGIQTRLSEIDGKRDFADYLDWRMKVRKVRRDTVEVELVGLRMVFRRAVKDRLATEKCIPQWDFQTGDKPKRERMGEDDYPQVLDVMKAWVRKANGDVDTYNRHLLQHVFLLIANTGMRTGEVLQLKNSDIRSIYREKMEVVIRIRKETSKVRKERDLFVSPSLGGRVEGVPINYLIRWIDRYQIHKAPDAYIFALFTKGSQYALDPFYRGYMSLREDLKEIGKEWWDAYHCRHLFATNSIKAGHPLAMIANAMGNSVHVIEKTYSHLLSEITSREMAKKRLVRVRGGGTQVLDSTKSSTIWGEENGPVVNE